MADIVGTSGDDVLTGTADNDSITGLAGNDTLNGGDSSDFLDGGAGNDTLNGGDGDDYLQDPTGGNDTLNGGLGNDFLNISRTDVAAAQLTFDGGEGDDRIYYYGYVTLAPAFLGITITGDTLSITGGAGNDTIAFTQVQAATINAGDGADYVQMDLATNNASLTLGAGSDILELQQSGSSLGNGTVEVTDFQSGTGGDRIYLTTLVDGRANDFFSSNPFGAGQLRLVQSGADTFLQYDSDGPLSSNALFRTILILRDTVATSLTQDNFGYPTDGSAGLPRIVDGTSGNDQIIGQSGNDTISGLAGNDNIWGIAGDDSIDGGLGDDQINGGSGNDLLYGGEGNDRLFSYDKSKDSLFGGDGSDYLDVSYFSLTPVTLLLDGGADNDYISYFNFGYASDTLTVIGGDGIDYIQISIAAATTIDAGAGDDFVFAELLGGTVAVTLGAGIDRLHVSQSQYATHDVLAPIVVSDFDASLIGGDFLQLDGIFANRTIVPASSIGGLDPYQTGVLRIMQDGLDTLVQVDRTGGADNFVTFVRLAGVSAASLPYNISLNPNAVSTYGSAGADVFSGTANSEHYYAGAGNDTISGGDGRDVLAGEAGDDLIEGGADNDSLMGGTGADRLYGGTGQDSYWVDQQGDLIFEDAGSEADQVFSTASFYLYANLEHLRLTMGAGDLFGVGNELNNVIRGNDGANLLIAGAGDDILFGDAANDLLYGQDGTDTLYGGAGIDYLVGGSGDDTLRGGDNADALYGEDGDDYLDGGASFDTDILVGGAGNDTLYAISGQFNPEQDLLDGGAGDDVYWVDTGTDLTFEALGGGIDTVHADVTVANAGVYLYANVENLVLEGTTTFGVGNELANQLTGNASVNLLLGGAGNDTINGMGGNDVLFGEAGNDIFVFGTDTDGDVIGDFTQGQDRIDISAFGFSFADAQSNFSQVGNDGAINLGNGDFIVLHGVTMANLTAGDFILVSAAEVMKAAPLAPASWSAADAELYNSDGLSGWMPLHNEAFV